MTRWARGGQVHLGMNAGTPAPSICPSRVGNQCSSSLPRKPQGTVQLVCPQRRACRVGSLASASDGHGHQVIELATLL